MPGYSLLLRYRMCRPVDRNAHVKTPGGTRMSEPGPAGAASALTDRLFNNPSKDQARQRMGGSFALPCSSANCLLEIADRGVLHDKTPHSFPDEFQEGVVFLLCRFPQRPLADTSCRVPRLGYHLVFPGRTISARLPKGICPIKNTLVGLSPVSRLTCTSCPCGRLPGSVLIHSICKLFLWRYSS